MRRVPNVKRTAARFVRSHGVQAVKYANAGELREARRGVLRTQIEQSSVEAAWGESTTNALADTDKALQMWLSLGFDPLLSLPAPGELRATEDILGSDLSSQNIDVLKESIAAWSQHWMEYWVRVLRLHRRSGASLVGMIKDSPVGEDEADLASTTWAEDSEFARRFDTVRDAMGERSANLELLELAIQAASAEKFAAVILAQKAALGSPHPWAPVPTTAEFHLEGDDVIREWATKVHKARADTEPVRAALRSAVDQRKWPEVAAELAERLAQIAAIRASRRQRQLAAGIKLEWKSMPEEQRRIAATAEADIIARSALTGEIDLEDKADNSEQWIEEHEQIIKLADGPLRALDDRATFNGVMAATAGVEALQFEHLYTAPQFRALHASALAKLYLEHTPEDVDAATVAVLRRSTYDARSGDLVPDSNAIPSVYSKAVWWRYCGPGVVTQHTDAGARQLLHAHHHVAAAPYVIALHYALRPLSSSIDYTTPHKHRQSLLRSLVAYCVSVQRVAHASHNEPLRSLFNVEDRLAEAAAVIAWPVGVARRATVEAVRARLEQQDFPVLSVTLTPVAEESTLQTRKALGVDNANAWLLGSTRTVAYDWQPITRASPAVHSNKAVEALQQYDQKRSVGIEVTLWRKVAPGQETSQSRLEKERFAKHAPQIVGGTAAWQAAVNHVAWELSRITDAVVNIPAAATPELCPDGYEFVAVLDDNHPGDFAGKLSITLPHRPSGEGNRASAAPVTPGVYRLRVRCFQHDVNPSHDASRASQAFSGDFEVADVLPAAMKQHKVAETLSAAEFLPFFSTLRKAGLAVTTGLEFEAGQSLTPEGDAISKRVIGLIERGQFAPCGAREGITAMQCTVESKVRRHWELSHPGATDEEWLCVRRFELDRAMREERDWWAVDDHFDAPANFRITSEAEARAKYAADFAASLDARGTSGTKSAVGAVSAPVATAKYVGDGTVRSLSIDRALTERATLDEVLQHCLKAIDRAHVRHNTLTAQRTREIERATSYAVMDDRHGTDLGGMYGKTYRFAYDRAVEQLGTETATGALNLQATS